MSKVKTFFKTISKYLGENVWIQPVLLVGLIFVIIFSISGFPNVYETVIGWFNGNGDTSTTTLKVETLSNDELVTKYEGNEEFFFVVGREDCVNCTNYYPALNSYYNKLKADSEFNQGVPVYYLDVTIEDEEFVDETVTEDTYIYWYDEIFEGTNTDLRGTRTGFATPTTIFVKDGKVVYALEGVRTVDQLSSYVNTFINEQ